MNIKATSITLYAVVCDNGEGVPYSVCVTNSAPDVFALAEDAELCAVKWREDHPGRTFRVVTFSARLL